MALEAHGDCAAFAPGASLTKVSLPSGMVIDSLLGPDPRFGILLPLGASEQTTTPSQLVRSRTHERTVTLSDPSDPLSLLGQSDVVTVNDQATSTAFDAGGVTVTTSPLGRQSQVTLDAAGRPVLLAAAGVEPVAMARDAAGHLVSVTQSSRQTTLSYRSDGTLASVTDALGQTSSFTRDAAGRLLALTRPDGAVVGYGYDPAGRRSSLATRPMACSRATPRPTPAPGRRARSTSTTPIGSRQA